jgi:FAD/FMN-containing dehydrogenase
MRPTTRRAVMGGSLALGAVTASPGTKRAHAQASATLDDASHLNATPVARHVIVKPGGAGAIDDLRRELKDAAAAGRPVAMGAARHSMGGQSLARNGTAFTFGTALCEPDRGAGIYRVSAGTRWHDVIATLDPLQFSPSVMQSNNDFGVASTFSVNAHGWPVPHGPFGSTVKAFRLMLADGSVVQCSRTENVELFRHVMGGYGLFGIIIDLDVEMTPNLLLKPTFEALASKDFGTRFPILCNDKDVKMAYGRLDVTPARFLESTLMISYRPVAGVLPAASTGGGVTGYLTHKVYRAEVGSDWGKRLRWFMETEAGTRFGAGNVTRNTLLNEGQAGLAETIDRRTDILHEYFIPPANFPGFIAACRDVILKSKQDLLNVTLRYLAPDKESILAYAPTERISAVMSFSMARTNEADDAMQRMTRDLIERVLAIGGSFYLPYRLHARPDQLLRAYPAIEAFVAAKRHYDPGCLFRNAFWNKWLDEPGEEK